MEVFDEWDRVKDTCDDQAKIGFAIRFLQMAIEVLEYDYAERIPAPVVIGTKRDPCSIKTTGSYFDNIPEIKTIIHDLTHFDKYRRSFLGCVIDIDNKILGYPNGYANNWFTCNLFTEFKRLYRCFKHHIDTEKRLFNIEKQLAELIDIVKFRPPCPCGSGAGAGSEYLAAKSHFDDQAKK